MRIKIFSSFEESSRQYKWNLWYAWHPIWIDGTIVWMEKVYRKRSATTTRLWCYKIVKYDSNGNLIHSKDSTGYEYWCEYDANGNCIHYESSGGFQYWKEYDTNGNCIHYKNIHGLEWWYEYDSNNNEIHSKNNSGFEYWRKYDANGNLHYKDSDGVESWYDSFGKKIDKPQSTGVK